MSPGWMLATAGLWSFMAMIALVVVLGGVMLLIERGLVRGPRPMEDAGPGARLRDLLGGGSLRRMGLVGWLGWLGMWCGIVGAGGLFVGVPWAALEERAERAARDAPLARKFKPGEPFTIREPIIPPSVTVLMQSPAIDPGDRFGS